MHFLLISENEFFPEIRCNGMTSFMDFVLGHLVSNIAGWRLTPLTLAFPNLSSSHLSSKNMLFSSFLWFVSFLESVQRSTVFAFCFLQGLYLLRVYSCLPVMMVCTTVPFAKCRRKCQFCDTSVTSLFNIRKDTVKSVF